MKQNKQKAIHNFTSVRAKSLTAFLLSLPRKYSNVFLFFSLSDKHFISQKSTLGTYGSIRSFSRKTCPGLYLKILTLVSHTASATNIGHFSNPLQLESEDNQFPVESISGKPNRILHISANGFERPGMMNWKYMGSPFRPLPSRLICHPLQSFLCIIKKYTISSEQVSKSSFTSNTYNFIS